MRQSIALVRSAVNAAGALGSTPRWLHIGTLLTILGACSDASSIPTGVRSPADPALARSSGRELGKVVFAADSVRADGQPSGFSALFVMSGDGSDATRLTPYDTYDAPAWAPDGRSIAFQRRIAVSPGSNDSVTYVGTMSPNGGKQRLLAQGEAPSWSPDGARIAFERQFVPSEADVFVMNADGSNVRQLTTSIAFDGEPTWSPDGGRIAFASTRAGGREVFVMNADGTNPKQLTGCGSLSASCADPAWSPVPGDERITYAMRTSSSFVSIKTIKSDRSFDIAVTSVAFGGEPVPSWSPDGSRLAFTGAGAAPLQRAVFAIHAVENAGAPTRLTFLGADERAPSWKK